MTSRTPRTPSKKPAKKAAKKSARKSTANVQAAAAPAPAKPSGVDSYVDPQKRMLDIDRRFRVVAAVRKASSRRKGGGRNKCWTGLDTGTQLAIAEACTLDRKSGEQIKAEFRTLLTAAKIPDRTLYRFIRDIREAFDSVEEAAMREIREHDQAAFASGDLLALLGHTYARLAPLYLSLGQKWIKEEASPDDLHPFLRFLEAMNDAAKTQASAKHKEMQTVMLAIKAEAADGSKVRTPKDRAASQQRIVDLVDRVLRGEAA